MEDTATVFVIDDDDGARGAAVALVRTMGLHCAEFASAEEYLCRLPNLAATGCIVTDVRMPGMSGAELQKRLQEAGCLLPIVFLTGYADVRQTVDIMRRGAVTLLEKPWEPQELWDAIRHAVALDATRRKRLAEQEAIRHRIEQLSEDERKVLEMVVKGCSSKLISEALKLGLRSVENRRAEVYRKMQANSLAELVAMVVQAREAEHQQTHKG